MNKIILVLFLSISLCGFSQNDSIKKDSINLHEIIVLGSLNISSNSPVSISTIKKDQISFFSLAEPSAILSRTPSITYYSDNGSSLGYTYYRLRGIDQTRLNITLNGVPLNEPEDQGCYFNNYPNFLSFIKNIQVIRGSGFSKVGTSNFGGSINFESEFSNKHYTEWQVGYGSNDTKFLNAFYNNKNLFIGINSFTTDGYKYHSGNNSNSFTYGTKFKLFNQNVKFIGITGTQTNNMAWVGETLSDLQINPRINSNKLGETDKFLNSHNQLVFEKQLKNSKIIYSLFYQYQNGWYDTDISLFDPTLKENDLISRIKLNYNWGGIIYNQYFNFDNSQLNIGGNYNIHSRKHTGLSKFQSDTFTEDYNNIGIKQEFSQYIKFKYLIDNFTFNSDIQNRYIYYNYISSINNLILYNKDNINFNLGVTYNSNNNYVYLSSGITSREPRRSDLFGGLDNYLGSINNLQPESVISSNLGYKYSSSKFYIDINLYQMTFKNEFMPTGEYGENSVALFTNVNKSYRQGIELLFEFKLDNLNLSYNLTLSDNKFLFNNEWKNSILSPNIISSLSIEYKFNKLSFGLSPRYNGKTYIDLNNQYTLPNYFVLDGYSKIDFKYFSFKLNLNNLTNSFILSNGMIGFDGLPRYFVMNKFNFLTTIQFKF